jgi:hypothetical protein
MKNFTLWLSRIKEKIAVLLLLIPTGFDADPDPGSQTNADPDPGQTLPSQKVEF